MRAAAIDESRWPNESPGDHVRRLALAKARAAERGRHQHSATADWPVLAADTVVSVGSHVFGKPADRAAFMRMFAALSGAEHSVYTAVALRWRERECCRVVRTTVAFAPVDRRAAAAYWATGEPRDKAGGYGIQGIGGIFVRSIRGSYSAVVGLPLAETEQLLHAFGVDTWRMGSRCPKSSSSK